MRDVVVEQLRPGQRNPDVRDPDRPRPTRAARAAWQTGGGGARRRDRGAGASARAAPGGTASRPTAHASRSSARPAMPRTMFGAQVAKPAASMTWPLAICRPEVIDHVVDEDDPDAGHEAGELAVAAAREAEPEPDEREREADERDRELAVHAPSADRGPGGPPSAVPARVRAARGSSSPRRP